MGGTRTEYEGVLTSLEPPDAGPSPPPASRPCGSRVRVTAAGQGYVTRGGPPDDRKPWGQRIKPPRALSRPQSRGVAVKHPGLWSRGRQFESARDYPSRSSLLSV